jgi:hypothetical protein
VHTSSLHQFTFSEILKCIRRRYINLSFLNFYNILKNLLFQHSYVTFYSSIMILVCLIIFPSYTICDDSTLIPEAPTAQANEIPEDPNKITVVYNYICEHKVKILVILGLTILILGGWYMYPGADINPYDDINIDEDDLDYYEPPIDSRDPADVKYDPLREMSPEEFDAWFKEWIKKP